MGKIKHAVIMAAGRGHRLMPLTANIPKAMVQHNGSTLICRGINQLRKDIAHVHITVGYKGAMLAEHVIQNGVNSVFNTEAQSNSWWVYNTLLKHLDEPVCVLTCDNVMELDFDLLEADYLKFGKPACMVVPVKPIAGLDGDYIFHKNNIVTELNRNRVSDIYCSGVQVINPAKINLLTKEGRDFYSLWAQLITHQEVFCSRVYPKRWFSVDTEEQLTRLNNEITKLK
jgi:N-acetyl-alpha-D-muramate 1-phosphate uridylyltransferase